MTTTPTRRSVRTVSTRYADHTIVGTPAQVANVLANHTTAGTLIAVSAPRPATTNPTDPRIQVRVRLHTTTTTAVATASTRPRRTKGIRKAIALAATATGVVTGLLAVVAYLTGQLVAFLTAHAATIVGAVTVLAIAAALLLKSTGGSNRHCPGC
jgi:lysylphosphatidylglycerol synthetase-like protein (DUF2156 family)